MRADESLAPDRVVASNATLDTLKNPEPATNSTDGTPRSTPAAGVPASRLGWAVHLGILLLIVGSNFVVRSLLDRAGTNVKSFLETNYPNALAEVYAQPWWAYFLPMKALTGAWQTTSLLLVHALEHVLSSPAEVFYFTNAVLVVTCYCLSWNVFRSMVFTVTFTLCFAWSTFNHHVYVISGSVALPLIVSYLLCFLFCQFKLMQPGCNYRVWAPAGLLSLVVYALAYESWLDCVAWMWLAYPVLIVLAYRAADYQRVKVAAAIVAVTTVAVLGYVVVKTQLGFGQQPGSESDVVMNYGLQHAVIALEDVIANWFTLVFIAITTYSPPILFNGSISSWRYGTEELIALQHGYHEQRAYLVGYSHLFLWRFYAGFAVAALLYGLWRTLGAAWREVSTTNVANSLFLLMTLMPGATHMLVKYRPMHSAPFLGYHSYFGIVGVTLLISYAMMWIHTNGRHRWLAWAVIVGVWVNVGYCALSRPSMLSHMAVESGFAPYPDAWKNLKELHRR